MWAVLGVWLWLGGVVPRAQGAPSEVDNEEPAPTGEPDDIEAILGIDIDPTLIQPDFTDPAPVPAPESPDPGTPPEPGAAPIPAPSRTP
ncbi:MAG: hypothetical protein JKY37_02325 [Nannocystaceae bacterium]|nr:hypothetical protein [Nannocystaceae bacterium]